MHSRDRSRSSSLVPSGKRSGREPAIGRERPGLLPVPGLVILALTTCVLALMVVGCGGEPASEDGGAEGSADAATAAPEEPRRGGTAVLGGRDPVPSLNPLTTDGYLPLQIEQHVLFTTLVRYDSSYAVRPYLARSWEFSEDSTSVVFHLRDDIRWHDGEPTTAEDVAFTFRTAKDPEVGFANRNWLAAWEGAEVVDVRTIRFTLRPHAEPLFAWTQLPIVPRHHLEGVAPADLPGHPFGSEEVVGNGPFRFVERAGSDRWVFQSVPDFPEAVGGRPWLERLVYRVVPDPTTLLAELRTGGVDLYLDVPPSQVARVRRASDLRVETRPSRTFTFIAWNPQRPYFAEPELRRALTLAIDRDALLRAVRSGLGTPASGPVGSWHWAHDPSWTPPPYAPDSARAILERAGWRDGDGDGIREKDGRAFRFELVTNPNPVREDIAVIVQSQLEAVGVRAEPRIMEPAALGAAVTSPQRRYDAAILGFEQDPVIDEREMWSCDAVGQPFQFTSYCDPALDPVLDSIPVTTDREMRRRLIRRYHEELARGQPVTWLFFEQVADGVRSRLRGVEPDSRGEFAGVRDWWLRPATVSVR